MGHFSQPTREWYEALLHPKRTTEEKLRMMATPLLRVIEHIYDCFDEIIPQERGGAGGGMVGGGGGKSITMPMKYNMSWCKPPTVQVQQPSVNEDQPWRFEIYSPGYIDGIGMFVDIRNPTVQGFIRKSVSFERQAGLLVFERRKSIFIRVGFYSNTAPAIAPPVSADEGKMFLRFSHTIAFTTYDEWKSHTPVLDSAAWLAAYSDAGVDINVDCSVNFTI